MKKFVIVALLSGNDLVENKKYTGIKTIIKELKRPFPAHLFEDFKMIDLMKEVGSFAIIWIAILDDRRI
jgi:hypothetical protein